MPDIFESVKEVTAGQKVGGHPLAGALSLQEAIRERIVSRPPEGCKQVFNIYYDPVSEQYVIVREE